MDWWLIDGWLMMDRWSIEDAIGWMRIAWLIEGEFYHTSNIMRTRDQLQEECYSTANVFDQSDYFLLQWCDTPRAECFWKGLYCCSIFNGRQWSNMVSQKCLYKRAYLPYFLTAGIWEIWLVKNFLRKRLICRSIYNALTVFRVWGSGAKLLWKGLM